MNCASGFRTNVDASCKSLRKFLTHLTANLHATRFARGSYWKKENDTGNRSFQERTSSYGQMTLSESARNRRRSSVGLTGENIPFTTEVKVRRRGVG